MSAVILGTFKVVSVVATSTGVVTTLSCIKHPDNVVGNPRLEVKIYSDTEGDPLGAEVEVSMRTVGHVHTAACYDREDDGHVSLACGES